MDLSNKKIVIIGGSSGIGLATAKAVVADGGNVIIASRSETKLKSTKDDIGKKVATYKFWGQTDWKTRRYCRNSAFF